MSIVFDTNVIISALLTHGLSSRVLDIAIDRHRIFISPWIIDEITNVLQKKFKVTTADLKRVSEFIEDVFEIAEPKGTVPEICHDKDDNNILHLAHYVKAGLIITGDKDLLDITNYKGTPIVSPRRFVEKYGRNK